MPAALKILDLGFGLSVQDGGRRGWRRFGLPAGGFIDSHSAHCANKLLENPPDTPLLELLLQGQKFEVLTPLWVAICGADSSSNIPLGRAVALKQGEIISFPRNVAGLWTYLAVAGGFDLPRIFGSASYYPRARLGATLAPGDILQSGSSSFALSKGVSGRTLHWQDRYDFANPPPIRLWPGPQLTSFSSADRALFCAEEWALSPQSDRVGYRLQGPRLTPSPAEIISEPVPVGSIQVPENGQPLITMPDGPTVGGYPKLALVHPEDLGRVAQTRPGQKLRFSWIDAARS